MHDVGLSFEWKYFTTEICCRRLSHSEVVVDISANSITLICRGFVIQQVVQQINKTSWRTRRHVCCADHKLLYNKSTTNRSSGVCAL